GVWIPVNLTVARLHIQPQTLALITARDIRERHETLQQLQKTEAELRHVLTSVSDCLWSAVVDPAGRWTYRLVSPVVERITGRPAAYFLNVNWASIVHREDRSRWESAASRLGKGEPVQQEYRIVRPDGGVRWVRESVSVSRDGEKSVHLDGVISDVS